MLAEEGVATEEGGSEEKKEEEVRPKIEVSKVKWAMVIQMQDWQLREVIQAMGETPGKNSYTNRNIAQKWIASREERGLEDVLVVDSLWDHDSLPLRVLNHENKAGVFGIKNEGMKAILLRGMVVHSIPARDRSGMRLGRSLRLEPDEVIRIQYRTEDSTDRGWHLKWPAMDSTSDYVAFAVWIADESGSRKKLGFVGLGKTSEEWSHVCGSVVRSVVKYLVRDRLGAHKYQHWGFFIESEMGRIVNDYLNKRHYVSEVGHYVLEGHSNRVNALQTSKDGCCVFSGSQDRYLAHWDLREKHVIKMWQTHSGPVLCLDVSGALVASAGKSSRIDLWNAFSHELIGHLDGHSRAVRCLLFNQRGTILASGSRDGTIRIWNMSDRECCSVMKGHSNWVFCLCFASDDTRLISGSYDHSIRVWDLESQCCIKRIPNAHPRGIEALSMDEGGSLLASSSFRSVCLWKWPEMTHLRTLDCSARSMCFQPGSKHPSLLAVSDEGGSVRLLQVVLDDSGAITIAVDSVLMHSSKTPELTLLSFSSDGRTLCATSERAKIISVFKLD